MDVAISGLDRVWMEWMDISGWVRDGAPFDNFRKRIFGIKDGWSMEGINLRSGIVEPA